MDIWLASDPGVVVLPDGRRVRGRALRDPLDVEAEEPDLGLYLTATPVETGWESRWVRWPDFWLPRSTTEAVAALVEVHRWAQDAKVEIACGGGTGRTGTAMAVLARLSGVPSAQAVRWVRGHYRPRAVETPWQRRWAARVELPEPGEARTP
ncbi:protein-tyrosine phosphatase family protein [Aeromicrobium sp. CTD01-1L150]|uniref:protein-tyrosine phosphatase family protein n=1 Tax=Aeromicrobium sp. CTD01-1L150 TaxID=3341830 RepID=UPI0035C182FA